MLVSWDRLPILPQRDCQRASSSFQNNPPSAPENEGAQGRADVHPNEGEQDRTPQEEEAPHKDDESEEPDKEATVDEPPSDERPVSEPATTRSGWQS